MKKLAILFLLTAVLVSFSFAQVSIKADLSIGDLTEESGVRDPVLALVFDGAASKEIGPGTLGIAAELIYATSFADDTGSAHSISDGDNFIKGSYALAAGPGTLSFWLQWGWIADGGITGDAWYLEPGVGYSGIAAGPANIGVYAWLDYKFDGTNSKGNKSAFSDSSDVPDVLGLKVTADFDFGLGIVYKFAYQLDHEASVAQIAYLDVNYKVMDPLVVGVELDNTAVPKSASGDDNLFFKGFQLKPYANYTLNDNVSLGAYFKLSNIAADDDSKMVLTPGVWVKYTF